MPSIIGTAVKNTLLAVRPIHISTLGAMLVDTMVSPLANSNEEYGYINEIRGPVCNSSLTKERVAPKCTKADTCVSFTTALTIKSKWSLPIDPEPHWLVALCTTGASVL